MSVELFLRNPGRYALSVAHAWIDFWTVPILWDHDQLARSRFGALLEAVWWIEHKLLRAANLSFVALVFVVCVVPKAWVRVGWNFLISPRLVL